VKVRLDRLLVDCKLAPSLEKAQASIRAGEVYVDDRIIDKPGTLIPPQSSIRCKEKCSYVSRGGLKLEKAIASFSLALAGKICVDIGASTGGFTDCLLQYGAARVFAIDVGYGQLAWKLRQDPRVTVIERFNARHIERTTLHGTLIDLAVIDVSFISLQTIIPPLVALFADKVEIVALIKPQFELPKVLVPGGVVKDPQLQKQAVEKIVAFCMTLGLRVGSTTESPILGPKGNTEFLIHLYSS
jgi:23S rRNA (cytidine1920-2'-O)/16S rRNA (cytidine1409-2'-O)-methyltransferase